MEEEPQRVVELAGLWRRVNLLLQVTFRRFSSSRHRNYEVENFLKV